MTRKTYLAIDGSLLCFKSCAGEERTVIATHRETGKAKEFESKTEFNAFLKASNEAREEHGHPVQVAQDFDFETIQHPPELGINIHIFKELMKDIINRTGADDYIVCLDHGESFRAGEATMMKYKDRTDLRPVNLQAIKDYCQQNYKTKICEGIEADDYMSMFAYKGYQKVLDRVKKLGYEHVWQCPPEKLTEILETTDRYIQCTFDKDARGCDGYMFDFRKDDQGNPFFEKPKFVYGLGGLYLKDDNKTVGGYGFKWFCFQLLNGDVADTFKPTKLANNYPFRKEKGKSVRFGEKAAFKVLEELKSEKDCMQAVVDKYQEWYPEPLQYNDWRGQGITHTKDWLGFLEEIFTMVHMHRFPDDPITAKDLITNLGIEI